MTVEFAAWDAAVLPLNYAGDAVRLVEAGRGAKGGNVDGCRVAWRMFVKNPTPSWPW